MRIRIPKEISPKKAAAMQERLAPQVEETSDLPTKLTSLVGCDATYFNGTTVAAAVLTDYNTLQPLRIKTIKERTRFPYIPGLLAFREGPWCSEPFTT